MVTYDKRAIGREGRWEGGRWEGGKMGGREKGGREDEREEDGREGRWGGVRGKSHFSLVCICDCVAVHMEGL